MRERPLDDWPHDGVVVPLGGSFDLDFNFRRLGCVSTEREEALNVLPRRTHAATSRGMTEGAGNIADEFLRVHGSINDS